MVALSYLDLTFDSILVWTVNSVLGSGLENLNLFTTQISILLMVSIAVPCLLTAVNIAHKRPLVVLGFKKWMPKKLCQDEKALICLRILIILFSPIVPALVLLSDFEAKEKKKKLEENSDQVNFSTNGGLLQILIAF